MERDIEDQHVSCVSCDPPRRWSKSAHERTNIVKGSMSSLEPITSKVRRVATRYVLCTWHVSGSEKGCKERDRRGCGRGIMDDEAEPDVNLEAVQLHVLAVSISPMYHGAVCHPCEKANEVHFNSFKPFDSRSVLIVLINRMRTRLEHTHEIQRTSSDGSHPSSLERSYLQDGQRTDAYKEFRVEYNSPIPVCIPRDEEVCIHILRRSSAITG